MNKPTRRLLTGLTVAALITAGTVIATESATAAPQGDTAWGAPAPTDTAWGTPPTDLPGGGTITPFDTAWG